jgi:hypothetical protein
MGCDGGSIPRRDEMVKLKKKAEKADKDVELQARWKYCALSGEELKTPIVACELGRYSTSVGPLFVCKHCTSSFVSL